MPRLPKQYDPKEVVKSKVKRTHEEWGDIFVYKSGVIKSCKDGRLLRGGKSNPEGKGGEVTLEGYKEKDYEGIVERIKEAFTLDCTVDEVLYYAGISKATLYAIFKRDPVLLNECKRLKWQLIFEARKRYAQEVRKHPEYARGYLETKLPEEFGVVNKNVHDVHVYKPVEVITVNNPYGDKEIQET